MSRSSRSLSTAAAALLVGCSSSTNPSVDVSSALASAQKLRDGHQWTQCVAEYGRIITGHSEVVTAFEGRAVCYTQLGTYERAIQDFSKAIQLSPVEPQLYIERAQAEAAIGNQSAAYFDYVKLGNLPAVAPRQYVAAASELVNLGFLSDALDLANLVERRYPGYWPYHIVRGDVFTAVGNLSRALTEYSAAVASAPGNDQVWPLEKRGSYYLNLLQYGLARADFDAAIKLSPSQYSLYEGRGRASLGLADRRAAISDFSSALDLLKARSAPDLRRLAVLLEDRGSAYLAEGAKTNAQQDFAEALHDIGSTDEAARARVAHLLDLSR